MNADLQFFYVCLYHGHIQYMFTFLCVDILGKIIIKYWEDTEKDTSKKILGKSVGSVILLDEIPGFTVN